MYRTCVSQYVRAPRSAVYRALLDPEAVAVWRVPEGMAAQVHAFEAYEGGSFRVSLTYDDPDGGVGKSVGHTDTYQGHFAELVPDERVVEVLRFETPDPALGGTMTMTTTLCDEADGTRVLLVHEGVPDAVPAADNRAGARMALAQLARFVEGRPEGPGRGTQSG
ncbi:SRPBCC domain-containing protein [Streptomyces sp. NPDC059740]|uniref:SRPBCC domain-containing protein n=1 Tax=Streptomyces sp. NPDC059740 TaxID=3346926 RepID=UPI003647FBFB